MNMIFLLFSPSLFHSIADAGNRNTEHQDLGRSDLAEISAQHLDGTNYFTSDDEGAFEFEGSQTLTSNFTPSSSV
jgi:hypothetical protein